jgi:hypothetical protein
MDEAAYLGQVALSEPELREVPPSESALIRVYLSLLKEVSMASVVGLGYYSRVKFDVFCDFQRR